ncbi:hypothetical protein [Actinoplanes regularis]|uniref:hypothetical protein n=1 Tax=Actinoplanes regularis TaxID=52697 RepID=UPI0024A55EA4|nr:hypothetical protein [Actinoplanes regularis]GLW35635.1 hypothetical protein Areg01_85700 [Actinoplanes regularis]
MTVCRDCCCGSRIKHPGVDHDAQLRRLEAVLTPENHRLRTSLCLDVYAEANVVVVNPRPDARRRGARPVWFGLVLDDGVLADIEAWVLAGGPGIAALPARLELSVIVRP